MKKNERKSFKNFWVGGNLQIINNLNGHRSGFLQPTVAAINCLLWVIYGFCQKKKEWPIIIANIPGVIFGTIAAITALI